MSKATPNDHAIVRWLFLHKRASQDEQETRLDQLEVLSKDEALEYAQRGGVPSER